MLQQNSVNQMLKLDLSCCSLVSRITCVIRPVRVISPEISRTLPAFTFFFKSDQI